jgi:hypothetical protein
MQVKSLQVAGKKRPTAYGVRHTAKMVLGALVLGVFYALRSTLTPYSSLLIPFFPFVFFLLSFVFCLLFD